MIASIVIYMRVTIVKLALFIVTVAAVLASRGDTATPPEMWLEIPELSGRIDANGFKILDALPPSGISQLRLHISNKQSGDISYGNIHTKVNTEAADDITTKRSTADGVLCDFDLSHWGEGFKLRPGRNSVEAYYVDRYQKVHYASFLVQFGGQSPERSLKRRSGPPEKIKGEKYAVIVGISEYLDPKLRLDYPADDARAFLAFLQSPRGGGFPNDKEHIKVLLNKDATTEKLRSALRTFLTEPGADDLVVIYFAGHGQPDKQHDQRNFYLLTYDTRSDDMGGTAFPMEELQDVFGRIIKAQHVITFVDSCNSYGVSGARTSGEGLDSAGHNDLTNQYLWKYGTPKKSFAIITASDVGERSYEDKKWGGGHGVFTYFLLEGLKGKAASDPRSDSVTAGDLFAYLSEQVPKATAGQQHPRGFPFPGQADNLLLSGTTAWQSAGNARSEPMSGMRH